MVGVSKQLLAEQFQLTAPAGNENISKLHSSSKYRCPCIPQLWAVEQSVMQRGSFHSQ